MRCSKCGKEMRVISIEKINGMLLYTYVCSCGNTDTETR
jgi:hypothetical protein